MRKNNSLMLAYIIFLFACVVARAYTDFPIWHTLVAAITITSGILSIADFANLVSKEWGKEAEDYLSNVEIDLIYVRQMLGAINRRLEKKDFPKLEIDTHTEEGCIRHYTESKERAERLLDGFVSGKAPMNEQVKLSKTLNNVSIVLNVVGFFAFFFILAFEPISNKLVSHQDVLTVASFGIILLTQYFGDFYAEKDKERQKTNEAMRDGLSALRKSFEQGVGTNAD